MKKLYLFILLLTFSYIVKSQTIDICGAPVPAGWVTVAVKPNYCGTNGGLKFIGRTITRLDAFGPGAVLDICGDDIPQGWVSISVKSTYCTQLGGLNYIGRTIKKIEGLPAGTVLDICGSAVPEGWISTAIKPTYCTQLGGLNYIGRTIKKIEGLPIGTVLNICGASVPKDWTQISVSGVCRSLGGLNYTGATIQKISGVVGQSITFNPLPVSTYGSGYLVPAVSASSGLPVTLSSSNPAVASIIEGRIRILGAGTAYITASQGGNSAYTPATSVSQLLTVNKANQSINFPVITAKSLKTPDFDPGATASSNLPVTYNSTNTQVATIVNGKVHIVGTGTTSIAAIQPGNDNFNAAGYFAHTLTVNKENQTITFAAIPAKVTGAADFAPGATASSGLAVNYSSSNTAVASISGKKIKIVGVGTTNITASQPGNDAFNAATNVVQVLTVKAPQTITFKPLTAKNMGAADFLPAATASSGLTVTFASSNPSVAAIVGGKVHIVAPGITTIVASQSGNGSFAAAPTVSQPLTVNKGSQTITFQAIPEKPFNAADFAPAATASSKLPITYTSSNKTVAIIVNGKIHLLKVGTTNITASQAGNSAFNAAANVTQLLTVGKAPQTITFKAIPEKLVGVADFEPGASASSGLKVTYTSSNPVVATIVNGKIHVIKHGLSTIGATQEGNASYKAAPKVNQLLVVKQTPQTITFKEIPEKFVTDPDFAPTVSASSKLPITLTSSNPAVATIVNGKIHILKKGVSNIVATQAGNAIYSPASASRLIVVKKRTQTITFKALPDKVVGAADFSPGATASSGLPVTYKSSATVVATIVNNKIHIIKDGGTIITASQAGNDIYEPATIVSQKLTIKKPNAAPPLVTPVIAKDTAIMEIPAENPGIEITENNDIEITEKPAEPIRKPKELTYNIYPNPASHQISIEGEGNPDADILQGGEVWIRIYNTAGLMEKEVRGGVDKKVTIPVGQLREGMYLVRITSGKKEITRQIMIRR